jgi:hypothetical protein
MALSRQSPNLCNVIWSIVDVFLLLQIDASNGTT